MKTFELTFTNGRKQIVQGHGVIGTLEKEKLNPMAIDRIKVIDTCPVIVDVIDTRSLLPAIYKIISEMPAWSGSIAGIKDENFRESELGVELGVGVILLDNETKQFQA